LAFFFLSKDSILAVMIPDFPLVEPPDKTSTESPVVRTFSEERVSFCTLSPLPAGELNTVYGVAPDSIGYRARPVAVRLNMAYYDVQCAKKVVSVIMIACNIA
jgi:hypothetical protein